MSTDESTILFPVNKLKAETLRSMAKDLGVMPGGKKEDLLQRMRTSSASGWTVSATPTPPKRKAERAPVESPSIRAKKPRTPRTAPRSRAPAKALSSPTRSSRRRGGAKSAPVEDAAQQDEDAVGEEDPQTEVNGESKPRVFDDYLVSGSTSVFISAEDLLAMVGELPTSTGLSLWKSTSAFADGNRAPTERVEHWLIPADKEDKIQNVMAFQEANKDVLEKEKKLKESRVKEAKAPNENGEEKKEEEVTVTEELTKAWWYEVSVSRNLGKGALAVKLIKGTLEGKGIVPLKDAEEEEGSFWLSAPNIARQSDSESLDDVVERLF